MAGREEEHLDNLVLTFKGMAAYQRELQTAPFALDRRKAAMYEFLTGFKRLRVLWRVGLNAEEKKRAPFHLRPKIHLLQHLVEGQLCLWGSLGA